MGDEDYLKKELRYFQNGHYDFYAVMRGHENADIIEVSEKGVRPYQERVDVRNFCEQEGIRQVYKNAQINLEKANEILKESSENPQEASKLVKEIHQNEIDDSNVIVDRWQLIRDNDKSKENNYQDFRAPKIYRQSNSN